MLNPLDAEVWLFDLDNTLYSSRYDLFSSVSRRMTDFIMNRFSLDFDQAKALQSKYFKETGTTLRGLMLHHDIPAKEFLSYVHDIDYSPLPANPRLNTLLEKLDKRKIIFTNGSTEHAKSVLNRLEITEHFQEFFDINDADYIPKPHPETYAALIQKHGFDPKKAILLEDMAINLRYAKKLGMQTVYIHTNEEWAKPEENADYIDHKIHDLTDWLESLL